MTNSNRIQRRNHRAGATVVEAAIVLPLVFLIFFGGMELCQMNTVQHSAQQASYEGARRGIVPGATAADAAKSSNAILNAVGVRGATVTVSPSVIKLDTKQVTVTVEIPFRQNAFFAGIFMRRASIASYSTLDRELLE